MGKTTERRAKNGILLNVADPVVQPERADDFSHVPHISRVRQYFSRTQSIMHTIFHGAEGCGKTHLAYHLLALHFGARADQVARVRQHTFVARDESEWVYTHNRWHFCIDAAQFPYVSQQACLVEMLMSFSETKNVANNRHQLLFIKNADRITLQTQFQLRRLMEVLYGASRLVFFVRHLDCIDDTIQSRCVIFRVHSPSFAALRAAACATVPGATDEIVNTLPAISGYQKNFNDFLVATQHKVAHTSVPRPISLMYAERLLGVLLESPLVAGHVALRKVLRDVVSEAVPFEFIFYDLACLCATNLSLSGHEMLRIVRTITHGLYMHEMSQRASEVDIEHVAARLRVYLCTPPSSVLNAEPLFALDFT